MTNAEITTRDIETYSEEAGAAGDTLAVAVCCIVLGNVDQYADHQPEAVAEAKQKYTAETALAWVRREILTIRREAERDA
jgi:hypothetical protein